MVSEFFATEPLIAVLTSSSTLSRRLWHLNKVLDEVSTVIHGGGAVNVRLTDWEKR